MNRTRFLKQAAAVTAASRLPARVIPTVASRVLLTDTDLQVGSAVSGFSGLARGSLTVGALRTAFRSPLIHAIRVAAKPGCVGVGWRYAPELSRNIAEIDVRGQSWPSELHFIEYVTTFFTRGSVSAAILKREWQ